MKLTYKQAEVQIFLLPNDDVIRTSADRLGPGEYGREDELEIFNA